MTEVTFLGIVIDSVAMECRLLEEKLWNLWGMGGQVKGAKKVKVRQVQSLLGKLNFACQVISRGRVFCRRLAHATVGMTVLHHLLRLSRDVR